MTTSQKEFSSQSGLGTYAGGRVKVLPTAVPPGEPGSVFNPVVVGREEQAARRANSEEAGLTGIELRQRQLAKGREGRPAKSGQRSLNDRFNPNRAHQQSPLEQALEKLDREDQSEPEVVVESMKGFGKGLVEGHRNRVTMNPSHSASVETIDSNAAEAQKEGSDSYGR
jgi:hypothetical protein